MSSRCDSNIVKYIFLDIELLTIFLILNNNALDLFNFTDRQSIRDFHEGFPLILTCKYSFAT